MDPEKSVTHVSGLICYPSPRPDRLVGAVGLAEAQDEPPGYADVIIVHGTEGVTITITTIEENVAESKTG